MTNTLMTFEEWLKTDEGVVKFGMNLSDEYKQFAWEGWQANQAQQEAVIAELVEALERISNCNASVIPLPIPNMDVSINHIDFIYEHQAIARQAIAKVKGK